MTTLPRPTRWVASLAIAGTGLFGQGPATPQDPSKPGRPTANYCALTDFGAPSAANPRRTEEPIWFLPHGAIAEGADQHLYSTSPSGGRHNRGTVFKMSPEGKLTVLHSFSGRSGSGPHSGLVDGKDGYLYGTTYGGGSLSVGTIFRIRQSGGPATVLYNFRNGSTLGLVKPCPPTERCPFTPKQIADAAGSYPTTPPILGPNGTFYGITSYTFNQHFGVLYAISPPYDSTTYRTLCIFDPRLERDSTMAAYVCDKELMRPTSLIVGDGGRTLYGTTGAVGRRFGEVFAADLSGKVRIIHRFDLHHGANPNSLMQASDGVLYGTTHNGGDLGHGTVFRLDPGGGNFRMMTSFRIGSFIAGLNPVAALIEGSDAGGRPDGYLYGTTRYGGTEGRGTIFKIRRDGDSLGLHVLHNFSLYATGRSPMTPLIRHSSGAFFGLTYEGGLRNHGAFFRLTNEDLEEQTTRPGRFAARGDKLALQRSLPTDPLVKVIIHAYGTQGGPPLKHLTDDGMAITVGCRNPHFVQFIYREQLLNGQHVPGKWSPSSGTYDLTTDPRNPVWHSDGAAKPNPFYDFGRGAGWSTYVSRENTWLTMFDQPSYPGFMDSLHVQQQDPHVYRATFRTFALCNCSIVREIRWTMEAHKGVRTYKDVKIWKADNSALDWINPQLMADGFRRLP